jgi:hypothetical protein
MDVKLESGKNIHIAKELTKIERRVLGNILEGKTNPNTAAAQEVLQRPHVAIAFEALLEKHNLTDDRLIRRLAEIITRRATVSTSEKGQKSTNVASIDANARDTVRMIWQAQGKFVEKHELGRPGEFKNLKDDELDKFIDSGLNFLLNKGKNTLDGSTITNRIPEG